MWAFVALGANLGDALRRSLRPKDAIPGVKLRELGRTALKVVRQRQRGNVESRAITAAGNQWKSEIVTGRVIVTGE